MTIPSEMLGHLESFFQLGFLFSGLEVSSSSVFLVRVVVFLSLVAALIWTAFKIIMKLLECVQAFLSSIASLPRGFFLLLLLVLPLSQGSIGAQWIGYLIVLGGCIALALVGVLILVLWKYGVEQALRFINTLRATENRGHEHPRKMEPTPPYNSRSETDVVPRESEFAPRLSSG